MVWYTGDLQRSDAVHRSGWRDTTFPYCWGRRRRSAAADRRLPRRSARNRPPKAQDLFCRMMWPSWNPVPGGVRYGPFRQDLFCRKMWSCRTLCAVQRFGRRKVYAGAIEVGSQAAPSPGHAAALSQAGAIPRSRARPSLPPCLRSRAPDASPQARHDSILGRASCLRLGSRLRTLPRPRTSPWSRRRRVRVLNTGSNRMLRSPAMEANSRPPRALATAAISFSRTSGVRSTGRILAMTASPGIAASISAYHVRFRSSFSGALSCTNPAPATTAAGSAWKLRRSAYPSLLSHPARPGTHFDIAPSDWPILCRCIDALLAGQWPLPPIAPRRSSHTPNASPRRFWPVSASALPPRRRARGATSNRAMSTSKPPAARMARDPSVPERQTCR